MNFIKERIGLYIYGLLSILEGIVNIVAYITYMDKIIGVADWSMPFYFWWCDNVLKHNFIKGLKENGKDI